MSKDIEIAGLRIVRERMHGKKILCDVVNYNGDLVLSGESTWVIDLCYERNYTIENWNEATDRLRELASNWGTF